MNKKEIQDKIIYKALKDEKFKNELILNPKKVLERELNWKAPANLRISVIEEEENTLHIVLPKIPKNAKLSDAELRNVAGGFMEGRRWGEEGLSVDKFGRRH